MIQVALAEDLDLQAFDIDMAPKLRLTHVPGVGDWVMHLDRPWLVQHRMWLTDPDTVVVLVCRKLPGGE